MPNSQAMKRPWPTASPFANHLTRPFRFVCTVSIPYQSIRMKISGHKTDSMERRYNIIDIEDVKSAAKQMAEWIKGEKDKS